MGERSAVQFSGFKDVRDVTMAGALQLAFPEHYENASLRDTKPVMHRIGDMTSYKAGVRNLLCFMEECAPPDPLQILLEKENGDSSIEDGEVMLDATADGFSMDDHPDEKKRLEPKPVSWRMSGRRLKEYRLNLMKKSVFSRINYDPKRKWIVTGATILPLFTGRMKKAEGSKAVATATA